MHGYGANGGRGETKSRVENADPKGTKRGGRGLIDLSRLKTEDRFTLDGTEG